MDFCSPLPNGKKKESCYSDNSLVSIVESWNTLNKDKITIDKNESSSSILKKLTEKFEKLLHKKDTFWAWTDVLKEQAKKLNSSDKYEIINKLKEVEHTDLRPAQPKEWVENPVEWLSNFDIDKCLRQYEAVPEFKYKFLGVFSIDFGSKDKSNSNINVKQIIKKGSIDFFGFITNLSKSNEPGTHWTSNFFVFNPNLPSFGGYYYDSTTGRIPQDLIPVYINIKEQAEKLFKKPFPIYINNKRHQKSNTECGIFSIAFQTRFLLLLRANPETTVDQVINHPEFNDNKMKKLRFLFFRPNLHHLKKI